MRVQILFVLILLLLSSPALAQTRSGQSLRLQTLDNYIVDLTIESDESARVVQSFDLINRYNEPVIPGRAKFVLFGTLEPEEVRVSIDGSARLIPEEDIVFEDGNQVVYYDIWRPITPGESLSIEINFRTRIEPQGVLFKQLDLSFGEPDIPIERMSLSLALPTGRSLTFSNLPVTNRDANTALIDIPSDVVRTREDKNIIVEYSSLPLPNLPFHGYWLWLVLIFMSAAILVLKIIMSKNEHANLA